MTAQPKSYPSIYVNRTCDRAPVWSCFMGTVYVLQPADGVGGSRDLGSVAPMFSRGYAAHVTVPGTRERQGKFSVVVGRYGTLAEAKEAALRGVMARHEHTAEFDRMARLCDRHDETLDLRQFAQPEEQAA